MFKIVTLFLVFMFHSCNWQTNESVVQVAWSDDDLEQAYIVYREDEKAAYPATGATEIMKQRHQLYVQSKDGSTRRALTGERLHKTGNHLFYMKKAGYVLLDVLESEQVKRFDIVRLSGGEQRLLSYQSDNQACSSIEVVPSPDGSILAAVKRESTETNFTGTGCPRGKVTVSLYRAGNLQLDFETNFETTEVMQTTWNKQNELLLFTATKAWKLKNKALSVLTALPKCAYPQTTSSEISSTGVTIAISDPTIFRTEGQPVQVLSTREPAFGCQ